MPGPSLPPRAEFRCEMHVLREMPPIIRRILAALPDAGFSDREIFGIRLSLEEAIVNAVRHGNEEDPAKKVCIETRVEQAFLQVVIEDEGPGFDPDRLPDPLAPENLERPGGRGVFLIRHYMTSVHFNDRGNRVTLRKSCGTRT